MTLCHILPEQRGWVNMIMTNFNERTNRLLYKNISLTLNSRKGWCWLCVRGELETGTDCYILIPSSSDHSSTSFASWLGCSTVGHWGPKALCLPLALNSASCPQLTPTPTGTDHSSTSFAFWLGWSSMGHWGPKALCLPLALNSNWLKPSVFRLYFCLTYTCSCLFTQVHLLIDSSVEGQYITHIGDAAVFKFWEM